jgi:hypothetical protein
MRKSILLTSLLAIFILVSAMIPEKSSSGAPPSHTGAPGELTCGTTDCHDDNTPNSGTAQLQIICADGSSAYVPGQTYTFRVKITDTGVMRFGFQVTALDAATNLPGGSFTITDKINTQLMRNYRQLTDRRYVTYTFDGTDAVSTGIGEWAFNWTAPATNTGAVIFYVAAVSGDDDDTDQGDHVYTTTFTFPPQ